MSWQESNDPVCTGADACDPVELVIEPKSRDIGAFDVRRALPAAERRMIGPFVFLDEFGPTTLAPGNALDVRPHPHIGIATVTWLMAGEIMHRDSLGSAQSITPGALNWMTAGRGIVHSERTPDHLRGKPSPMSGLQAWVALPKSHEEAAPTFVHHAAADLPRIEGDGAAVAVVAGRGWGAASPVEALSGTFYADAKLEAGATLVVPAEVEERGVYVISGGIGIAGTQFGPGRLLALKPGGTVDVTASEASRFVVIGGDAMDGPRHLWWNFVSSSKERIEQAKADWREGRFDAVPGDDEFIPLP